MNTSETAQAGDSYRGKNIFIYIIMVSVNLSFTSRHIEIEEAADGDLSPISSCSVHICKNQHKQGIKPCSFRITSEGV